MTTLPPELISLCLSQLDPDDRETVPTLLSASLASSSFRTLATSHSLWKRLADCHYHQYRRPTEGGEEPIDAFRYYASRAEKDQRAREIVRDIQRPLNRLPLVDELRTRLGSDVIENRRWAATEFTEERRPETWLSLRYWAGECRKTLLRDEALATWREIAIRTARGEERPDDCERGLDAFAAFRGIDPKRIPVDRYDMRHHAPLVEATRNAPFTGTARLEWLAKEVVDYMRSIGLRPSRDGGFHSLDNHYTELVWARTNPVDGQQNEGTLPMTLVSIFCALIARLPAAKELGVRARLIGYPGTVLAGLSYEGQGGQARDRIFINVFGEGKVLSPERLRAMLGAMGQDGSENFLAPAGAREICLRVARNILTSVRAGDRTIGVPIAHELSVDALYSVSHALFLFTSPDSLANPSIPAGADTLQYAEWLESLVQSEYPLDVAYLTERVGPMLPEDRRERLEALCEAIRHEDATPKEQKLINARIKWPVGHVFRHRLFGYLAITRGFDYTCEAGEQWIRTMRVDTLAFGRNQPFYHVIVADGSARYVAQENITDSPVPDDEVDQFFEQESLGRYFRRRERIEPGGRWAFVASEEVAAEYPESVVET
ncbi:hypothetical protein BMF94_5839 [Rhodotorula taiwanensis]|uniref:F-box domain-containing protein n=1 Tax=Rhodotorula taiwanensis TaxID=741276 RepID=A0A2S5B2R8_9BASI|nr:hypothetical protein BMF94_5839 [Rhodotorula taiwanensis]